MTAKPKSRSADPLWYLLAEYSLSNFSSDDIGGTLWEGLLFQTIRDLGVQPDCLNNIKMILIGYLQRATAHRNQGKKGFPIVIGLFYKKKNDQIRKFSQNCERSQAKQTTEAAKVIHPAYPKKFGGWGFFVIERARDFPASSSAGSPYCIDLYLYREGE